MATIRNILVAVKDPDSLYQAAVLKGARLAQAFDASVVLYHGITEKVIADPYSDDGGVIAEFERETEDRYARGLETIASRLRTQGLRVSLKVDWDYPPHEAIVREAQRREVDLIVAECHAGRRRLKPWMLHLTDWELLRTSAVPVLLVKNGKLWKRPVVVAAVDPSHALAKQAALDASILEAASTFSSALQGSLRAAHCFVPVPPNMLPGLGVSGTPASEIAAESEARATKELQRVLEAARLAGIPRHVVAGQPVDAIPEVARDVGCDILVMGAVSRSGLKRVFIGNTAERVLNDVTCDVLVVKPRDFTSRVSAKGRGVRYVPMPPLRSPR